MMSYGQLFLTILPVFAMIALGTVLKRTRVLREEGEESLFNLVVNVTYPCLIFESVANNPALHEPRNLLLPPLVGFGLALLSMFVSWHVAKALGLTIGTGLRTFALAVGLANYGYLPLPIMDAMFGPESRAVLLVHNVGIEAAIWTAGILVITGLSPREGWRRLVNAPVISLLLALVVNLTGAIVWVSPLILNLVHTLGVCAIPLGLIMTGVSIEPHLNDPRRLVHPRVTLTALLLRLLVLPCIFLFVARWLPCSVELKRVLVVQAAMPSAAIPVIIARVYGGQPLVAVQILLGTTVLAIFTIPFWIRFGMAFVGLAAP